MMGTARADEEATGDEANGQHSCPPSVVATAFDANLKRLNERAVMKCRAAALASTGLTSWALALGIGSSVFAADMPNPESAPASVGVAVEEMRPDPRIDFVTQQSPGTSQTADSDPSYYSLGRDEAEAISDKGPDTVQSGSQPLKSAPPVSGQGESLVAAETPPGNDQTLPAPIGGTPEVRHEQGKPAGATREDEQDPCKPVGRWHPGRARTRSPYAEPGPTTLGVRDRAR
ncbi:hypothetical protein P3T39_007265 [Kitasatospora sp. GP82]|nr:hypothetical protein [Kitasatospora sp. GP82]